MFLARSLSFALVLVFAWAATAKIVRAASWGAAFDGYGLPRRLRTPALVVVPAVEAAIAALYLVSSTRLAAAMTLLVVAAFSFAIVRAYRLRGSRLPCGCFGSSKERDHRTLLVRNAALASAAAGLLLYGRDVPGYPELPRDDAWVAALLAVAGVVSLLWLITSVRSGFRRGAA